LGAVQRSIIQVSRRFIITAHNEHLPSAHKRGSMLSPAGSHYLRLVIEIPQIGGGFIDLGAIQASFIIIITTEDENIPVREHSGGVFLATRRKGVSGVIPNIDRGIITFGTIGELTAITSTNGQNRTILEEGECKMMPDRIHGCSDGPRFSGWIIKFHGSITINASCNQHLPTP